MTRFAARCLLVGAAIVLALVGTFAALPGSGRAVLLAAGACCAVLDVLVARTPAVAPGSPLVATAPPPPVTVPVVAPGGVPTSDSTGTGLDGTEAPSVEDHLPDGSALGDTVPVGVVPTIVLGRDGDGRAIAVAPGGPFHLVVLGAGALAVAVFQALALQIVERHGRDGDVLRAAADPDLGDAVASLVRDGPCPRLPAGTAAVALLARDGRVRGSVVLVPTIGGLPLRWDRAIEVSRYGCRLLRRDGLRGGAVSPVLPTLPEPTAPP